MECGKKMTCGRALAVTAVATLCLTLDVYAASDPPSKESPSRRWNSNHVLRASMSLGEGDFADREGVRLSLRYDVPVRKLGSGRLLAGPTAHFMFANGREERAGRAVSHEDRMGQVGVGARYMLNLKRVFQPWLAAGVTFDFKRHRVYEIDPGATSVGETASNYAPGGELGAGIDFAVHPSLLISLGGWAHVGQPNFAAIAVGLGLRFP